MELAQRVHARIHPAAVVMCQRIFLDGQNCLLTLSRYKMKVKPADPTINAHIDMHSNITIYGGLIGRVGSEDELAAVLAHEYSHGLMQHIRKKMRNMTLGSAIGLAAGATVGAISKDAGAVRDGVRAGTNIGMGIGSLVYSQAMENEADHVGLFILHEAGYDKKAASHFHMRILKERRFTRNRQKGSVPFYWKTHPSHKERIQKLVAAEEMIERGYRQPMWKRK